MSILRGVLGVRGSNPGLTKILYSLYAAAYFRDNTVIWWYSRTSILVTPSVTHPCVTKIEVVTKIGVHFYDMNLHKR